MDKLLEDGTKLLTSKQPAQAIELFDKVIASYEEKSEKDVRTYSARTLTENLLYLLEAANSKRSARVVSSNYAYAYFLKGYAYIELRQPEQARLANNKALELAPHNAQFLAQQGYQLARTRDWNASLAAYQKAESAAREFSPENSQKIEINRALRGQGFALVELDRLADAEKIYQTCLTLDAKDKVAADELAYVQAQIAKRRP